MIYPDFPVEYWCEKHNIKVKKIKCPNCGFMQETTIPIICQEFFGLIAPPHKCGTQYQAATMVARDPNQREEWKEFAKLLLNAEG